MKEKDRFFGPVVRVIDGDTLLVQVASRRASNRYPYGGLERVRLADINAPERNTPAGKRATEAAVETYLGRRVAVTVRSRDKYKRVIGTPKVER